MIERIAHFEMVYGSIITVECYVVYFLYQIQPLSAGELTFKVNCFFSNGSIHDATTQETLFTFLIEMYMLMHASTS